MIFSELWIFSLINIKYGTAVPEPQLSNTSAERGL